MNTGKTLFAQIMDFLPWSTFDRILPGEFGSANRTAVISSRYRSLHMSHVPVFARARYLCKNFSWNSRSDRVGDGAGLSRILSLRTMRIMCSAPSARSEKQLTGQKRADTRLLSPASGT